MRPVLFFEAHILSHHSSVFHLTSGIRSLCKVQVEFLHWIPHIDYISRKDIFYFIPIYWYSENNLFSSSVLNAWSVGFKLIYLCLDEIFYFQSYVKWLHWNRILEILTGWKHAIICDFIQIFFSTIVKKCSGSVSRRIQTKR